MITDCYILATKNSITIGNTLIERNYLLMGNRILCGKTIHKETGYSWEPSTDLPAFCLPGFDEAHAFLSVGEMAVDDWSGLSQETLKLQVSLTSNYTIVWEVSICSGVPFVTTQLSVRLPATQNNGGIPLPPEQAADGVERSAVSSGAELLDAFPCSAKHIKRRLITLQDRTDMNDSLVLETQDLWYPRWERYDAGTLLAAEDYLAGETCILIKHAPMDLHRNFWSKGGAGFGITAAGVDLTGLSKETWVPLYRCAAGVCSRDADRAVRLYYRSLFYRHLPFVMSNTWGDRSQDKCVCEPFLRKEIELARKTGVEIVQIDDGWQKGITANSALASGGAWGSYYEKDPDFWQVHPAKFPHGLAPVVRYAEENGVSLGLWFSPDQTNCYENYQKDAQVLLSYFQAYGIRYFKLDGIQLEDSLAEYRFGLFLNLLHQESGGAVHVNLDITAGRRLGYLDHCQYGTLFVENRYTDWGNYYPHRTLRSLWQLSFWIPAQKLQMELLNVKRNQDNYIADPFAPIQYDPDYLFASVMGSNPLLWMELSGLEPGDADQLSQIICVYQAHKSAFSDADIRPIGQEPDGQSFTGFEILPAGGSPYYILLRETTPSDSFDYGLPLSGCAVLATNDAGARIHGTCVTFTRPRAYLFIKHRKE